MDIIISFILLGVIGIASYKVTQYLNSDISKLILKAEYVCRERLLNREKVSVEDFFSEHRSGGKLPHNCKELIETLSTVFQLENEFPFSLEERLGDIFRVSKSELKDVNKAWNKAGLVEYLEVYSDTLIEKTRQCIGSENFQKSLHSLGNPSSEDEIKDVLMEMTVAQYLITFSSN